MDEDLGDSFIAKISSNGIDRVDITGTKLTGPDYSDYTYEIITNHFSYFKILTSTVETPANNPSG